MTEGDKADAYQRQMALAPPDFVDFYIKALAAKPELEAGVMIASYEAENGLSLLPLFQLKLSQAAAAAGVAAPVVTTSEAAARAAAVFAAEANRKTIPLANGVTPIIIGLVVALLLFIIMTSRH